MIVRSIKPYLHRPIRILQFFTREGIQKNHTYLQNLLAFLTIRQLQPESRMFFFYIIETIFTIYNFIYIVSITFAIETN